MMGDEVDGQDGLESLAASIGACLKQRKSVLAVAESCTGGWIAQVVTSVAGSSEWFDRGWVSYSNAAKQEMLGVRAATIEQFGAVSEETAREMAAGALVRSGAQVALAVTGIAGPGGGSPHKPVGTVCFAWSLTDGTCAARTRHFAGERRQVRRQSVRYALEQLLQMLHCT